MENELVISEGDLAPVIHEDCEVVGALEALPSSEPDATEELIRKADAEHLEDLKQRFTVFLGGDQLLKGLFECLCQGILKRAAIARKLNISSNAFKNAKRRLDRQSTEFKRQRNLQKVQEICAPDGPNRFFASYIK